MASVISHTNGILAAVTAGRRTKTGLRKVETLMLKLKLLIKIKKNSFKENETMKKVKTVMKTISEYPII